MYVYLVAVFDEIVNEQAQYLFAHVHRIMGPFLEAVITGTIARQGRHKNNGQAPFPEIIWIDLSHIPSLPVI